MRNYLAGIGIAVMCLVLPGNALASEELEQCKSLQNGISRLACYDKISGYVFSAATETPAPTRGKGKWRVQTEKSPLDDSTNVFVALTAEDGIKDRFGRPSTITLTFACRENKTSAWFTFKGLYMADIQGYGDVTYRIDSRPARTRGMTESTDNEALGLWNGGGAIPFAKDLFEGESMYVRATPFSESAVSDTFPIAGLENAIQPLREACNW